jgi:hypothetical protein
MKQNLAESVLDQLQLRKAEPGFAPQAGALLEQEIGLYTASVKKYAREKEEIRFATWVAPPWHRGGPRWGLAGWLVAQLPLPEAERRA